MAVVSDVVLLSSELNKLKKSELIDLLISNALPDSVTSEVLIDFVNKVNVNRVEKCNCTENINDLNNTILSSDSVKTVINREENLSMEIKYLRVICEQKDKVIANQSITINALQNHNILLNNLLMNNSKDTVKSQTADGSPTERTSVSPAGVISTGFCTSSIDSLIMGTSPSTDRKSHPASSSKAESTDQGLVVPPPGACPIGRQQVAIAVDRAVEQTKINDILSLCNNSKDRDEADPWITVEREGRRKKSRTIVGTGNASNAKTKFIKAAPSMTYFHVFKLDPSVTAEDIVHYLRPQFPEATCNKLTSKYPDEYSSFKVGVFENNASMFLEPSRWATGTRINKFFHPRKKNSTPK